VTKVKTKKSIWTKLKNFSPATFSFSPHPWRHLNTHDDSSTLGLSLPRLAADDGIYTSTCKTLEARGTKEPQFESQRLDIS
jgi:hypothetical protein